MTWYKPINQSLQFDGPFTISSIEISPDNTYLFLTGNSIGDDKISSIGWTFSTVLSFSKQQISQLKWETVASTPAHKNSVINTVIPVSATSYYIGGNFDTLVYNNGTEISVNNIAHYNGENFTSLAGGTNGEVVTGTLVTTIQPEILYIAGNFTQVGVSTPASNIARWQNPGWDSLSSGLEVNYEYTNPLGSPFLELGSFGSVVVVGGAIIEAGGIPVNNVALWDGSSWDVLGDDSDFNHFRMLPFSISTSGTVYFAAQGLENTIFEDIIVDGMFIF